MLRILLRFQKKLQELAKKLEKVTMDLEKITMDLHNGGILIFFSFHIEKSLPRCPKTLPTLCLISDPRASISHHKRLYSTALGRHFHVSDRSALWRFRGFEPSLT